MPGGGRLASGPAAVGTPRRGGAASMESGRLGRPAAVPLWPQLVSLQIAADAQEGWVWWCAASRQQAIPHSGWGEAAPQGLARAKAMSPSISAEMSLTPSGYHDGGEILLY